MSAATASAPAPLSFAAIFNPQDPNPTVIILCAIAAAVLVIGTPIWMMSQ